MHHHRSGRGGVLAVCPAYLIDRVSEEIDDVNQSRVIGYEVEGI
jgi:hypothetical protein